MSETPSHLQFLNPQTMPPSNGYSHVAVAAGGRTIYLSGQIALAPDGKLVGEGDIRAQTEQVFNNLKTGLEAAGADFSHVVKLNFYLLDAGQIAVVREVRDHYVNTANPPASTAVEIRNFVRGGLLIEIDAVAVVSG